MLSAVSAQGALRFTVHEGTVNAAVFIDFCKRLLRDTEHAGGGPVYLVVDDHPAHRAKATAEFVASTNGRLQLFFLPGYSPELNPDKWVWKNVKHDRIGKTGASGPDDLKARSSPRCDACRNSPRPSEGSLPIRACATSPHSIPSRPTYERLGTFETTATARPKQLPTAG
jgi:transposase